MQGQSKMSLPVIWLGWSETTPIGIQKLLNTVCGGEAGWQARQCRDILSGQVHFQTGHIILLDDLEPPQDNCLFVERFRSLYPEFPIVALGSSVGTERRDALLSAGAFAWLQTRDLTPEPLSRVLQLAFREGSFTRRLARLSDFETLLASSREVAHDLSNLLTGILGFSEIAQMQVADPRPRKALSRVSAAAREAEELIQRLLGLHQSGNREELEVVDFSKLTRKVLEQLRPQLELDGVSHIGVQIPQTPLLAMAEPAQMGYLLADLMLFVSSLGPGQKSLEVTCGRVLLQHHPALQAGDYVRLQLKGSSIEKSHDLGLKLMESLLQPGGRLHKRSSAVAVILASKAVRRLQGHMEVRRNLSGAIVMELSFPLEKPEPLAPEAPPVQQAPFAESQGSRTILVIDDELLIRETVSRLLEHLGYTCLIAENGEEGIRMFREHHSSVGMILLDLSMPGISGPQCLQELLRIDPEAQVVISSGLEAQRRLGSEMTGRIAGFLPKPFRLPDLRRCLESVFTGG